MVLPHDEAMLRRSIREEITSPESLFFTQDGEDWNAKGISSGDTTDAVDTIKFGLKTIYFHSNTAGTLTIEVQKPDGTWLTYDTISASANTLESYIMNVQAIAIRLSFTFTSPPDTASVTAWIVMRYI